MLLNIRDYFRGIGSSKGTREEEKDTKLTPETLRPNRALLLKAEHIPKKYNPWPPSATESGFHNSRKKLTPETPRSNRATLMRDEHMRKKYNLRSSSATESGFRRSSEEILEQYSAPRSTPYNVNIVSKRSDERATSIQSSQLEPTTESHEDKSDVITSLTLMCDTGPKNRSSDSGLITSSQLKDSSVIHQDEKSILRKEQTHVCKRYENGDKISNCKSSKHNIDYFNEKYKLYDYSNDSKLSAELGSYYQSQTVINNSLVEPTGQKHQDRNNEIHSENFTGNGARVPSPLHEDKSNENDKAAIPYVPYIEEMSDAEIREMVHHAISVAMPHSSSLPIPHRKDYFHHETETQDTNEEITRGKIEQIKTPYEDKTSPSVSHETDSACKTLTGEFQILGENQSIQNRHTGRTNTSPRSKTAVDTPREIHENNKGRNRKMKDNISSDTTDSDNFRMKLYTYTTPSMHSKNSRSQPSQLKVDYELSLRIPREDTSYLEKGARYSSVTTDCSSMVAFDEHTLPDSQKSTKVLSSDGHKQNVTRHTSAPWRHVHPIIDGFQQTEGKLQLYEDNATDNEEKLKDLYVQKHCKEISKSPHIFLAKGITPYVNKTRRLKRVEVGEKKLNGTHEKVIMIVGATGAGKTRLINALFNQIVGVKWNDKVKLCLINESGPAQPVNQAKSQTDWVTAYSIHHDDCFTIPYTITVIDTPGFGDTSGIIKDNEIPKQLHELFSRNDNNGIDHLDAVGFVIQSSLSRLTAMQTYIFDSILGLFGKDIQDNIFLMLTFADGQNPQAMSSIEEASLPYQNYYPFNNGCLYDTNMSVFGEAYWNMGVASFCNFLKDVAKTEPKTICLTKAVLKFRYRQEKALQNIQRNMSMGLNTIEELQKEKQILIQHQKDIEKNKSFTYVATEQYICETKVHDGFVAIKCKACHITCYETVVKGRDREEFLAVCIDGYCPTCPERCNIAKHQAEQMSYVFKRRKVQRTSNFLKKKYEESLGKKMDTQRAIEECSRRMAVVYDETLKLVEKARRCEVKLREIALKPDALPIKNYIDLLIEAEKRKSSDNLAERLVSLNELKELCTLKQSVLSGTFKPFGEYHGYDVGLKELDINHEPTKTGELFEARLQDEHLRELSDRITDQRSLRNLGNALQVEPHHVSSSLANNRYAVTEAAYNVLTIWFKNKESPFVAWEELSEALEKCEMKMWKYEVLERKEYESS